MRNRLRRPGAVLAGSAFALASTAALAGGTGADAFNRPKLGAGWTIPSGTLNISGDQLHGSSGAIGYLNVANKSNAGSAVVFLGGTDLEYGAVAVGDVATGTNAFVKIQAQNGTGMFDTAGFYTGNNGGGDFFTLSSTVASPATLDAAFCGTTAYMRITSASGVQVYSYNYGTSVGKGGGLGTYGSVGLDNFIAYAGNCTALKAAAVPAERMPRDRDLSLER